MEFFLMISILNVVQKIESHAKKSVDFLKYMIYQMRTGFRPDPSGYYSFSNDYQIESEIREFESIQIIENYSNSQKLNTLINKFF